MSSKFFNSVFAPLFILIPIVAGAIKFKILNFSAKLIWYYLILTALINTLAIILARKYHLNNLPLIHLFTVVEMLMLIWHYKNLLTINKSNKAYIALAVFFVLISITNALFFQSIYTYSSYTRSVESIICMLFALNYFAKLASTNQPVKGLPSFYFNTGIFLYFTGSFILFVFSNFLALKLSTSNFIVIWNIHAFLFMIMYIFFSIGFFLCKK